MVSPEGTGREGRFGSRSRREGVSVSTLEKLFDRLPPHSLEAERSLLGSLLLEPVVLADVLSLVSTPEHFYSEAHGAIFKAIVDAYEQHRSGDVTLVSELLNAREQADSVGGVNYLVELAGMVPSARNAPKYARIVADKAKLRRLIDAAGQILYDAYHAGRDESDDAATVIDAAEQQVFEIAQQEETNRPEKLAELLTEELDRIEAASVGKGVQGVPTGYADLDGMLNGLQPGEMVVIAARPSVGKTALAMNIAEQVAFGGVTPWQPRKDKKHFVPVGFFSLEMSKQSLAQRLLSARSGVDGERLRKGDVRPPDWDRLNDAAGELSEVPLYVDDTPGLTILQLRAKARRMADRFGIKAVFIDYLQLLTAPAAARESRQVEVSAISRQIKSLARELKLPIVCLAQLNRGVEQRGERSRPRMSDLRESGSIEQDADVVILLHREAYSHRGEPEWDPTSPEFNEENRDKLDLAELIIAKQRNGPTGTVRLTWDDTTTRFKSRDDWHAGDPHPAPTRSQTLPPNGPPAARYPAQPPAAHSSQTHTPQTRAPQNHWSAPAARDASGAADSDPYADPFGSPRIHTRPLEPAPPSTPRGGGGSFAPPQRSAFGAPRPTGPVEGHRDGGGPDRTPAARHSPLRPNDDPAHDPTYDSTQDHDDTLPPVAPQHPRPVDDDPDDFDGDESAPF